MEGRWARRRDDGGLRWPKPATSGGRSTQAAQRSAKIRQISPRAYRRRRAFGWSLVSLAIVVGVSHRLTHGGVWDFARQGIEDLVAGYPMAALLGIGGVVVLSR